MFVKSCYGHQYCELKIKNYPYIISGTQRFLASLKSIFGRVILLECGPQLIYAEIQWTNLNIYKDCIGPFLIYENILLVKVHPWNKTTRLPGAMPQPLFLLLIVFGCIIFFEVVFDFPKKLGRLPFSKKLRSSSIFKNIIVF